MSEDCSPLRRASLGVRLSKWSTGPFRPRFARSRLTPVNGGGNLFSYLKLQARRRPRRIAPAGWLALTLIAAACLGLFAADRAASVLCLAMGPRCVASAT
jgi:hypothetical protein